jgi:ferredoxin
VVLTPVGVVFGEGPDRPEKVRNAVGVEQETCTYLGECVLGCPRRAKTTMDLTYIPLALRHGAELRVLAEVTRLERRNGQYRVVYKDREAGRERFFIEGRPPFSLPLRDPVLYFIQRLRDEAHRFVIGSHRKLRKKDIREAGLQEIPGIGPSRKRALLHHFGTLKAIEHASVADLAKVPGISAESARRIYEFFHSAAG